uniref:Uncharacterized protein n=1 Tax=Candidatus Kentrum sp. LPFa TaxID=2126335 RepID=A0A450WRK7_9GAMM|nr:MAG: hypothetical protein BECKLPF1236B_GA0070989_11794 [Candidatus Kentron sp. LPFa]
MSKFRNQPFFGLPTLFLIILSVLKRLGLARQFFQLMSLRIISCHFCWWESWRWLPSLNFSLHSGADHIFTFPENPEQNDQKIRESKKVVFHRPFWFRIFRVGFFRYVDRASHPCKNSRPIYSECGHRGPGYDTQRTRKFEFIIIRQNSRHRIYP